MDPEKWMVFINQFWWTLTHWQMIQLYKSKKLDGAFFALTGLAIQDKLLMEMVHTIHLCDEIAKNFDVGREAEQCLGEIKELFDKGESGDRGQASFQDCGIKPYRDKVLAHPIDHVREILGKGPIQISLKWETVEETFRKIKEFCNAVEQHHAGGWDFSTYKDEVSGADIGLEVVLNLMEDGKKYDELRRQIIVRERVMVGLDSRTLDLVIREETVVPGGARGRG